MGRFYFSLLTTSPQTCDFPPFPRDHCVQRLDTVTVPLRIFLLGILVMADLGFLFLKFLYFTFESLQHRIFPLSEFWLIDHMLIIPVQISIIALVC